MPFLSENSGETLSFWSTYYIYRIIHTYILRPHFPCHLNILVMEVAKSFDFSEIERKNVGEKWVAKACPDPSSSKPCRIGHASPISPSTAFLATSSEAHRFIALVVKTASTLLHRMRTLIEVLNKNHYAKSLVDLFWCSAEQTPYTMTNIWATQIGSDVWNLESFKHQFPWHLTW